MIRSDPPAFFFKKKETWKSKLYACLTLSQVAQVTRTSKEGIYLLLDDQNWYLCILLSLLYLGIYLTHFSNRIFVGGKYKHVEQ